MPKPPDQADAGDRVRITFDTTLVRVGFNVEEPGDVTLGVFGDSEWLIDPDPTVGDRKIVNVEVLPPPEPEWRRGDVIMVAGLSDYPIVRGTRSWDRVGDIAVRAAWADGRVRLVVRDGEPVL